MTLRGRTSIAGLGALLGLAMPASAAEPEAIRDLLNRQRAAIMAAPGVMAVGIGACDGAPCIKVFAKERSPALRSRIDELLAGAPYRIECTERFDARPDKQ